MNGIERTGLWIVAAIPVLLAGLFAFVAATRPWDGHDWFPGSVVIGAMALVMLGVAWLAVWAIRDI